MARLNDYAAPAESVEALKRRFVRQNRDIVRVNSMQSLRIRSLESEVSHLLAENVSLREQIINLTQEIDRYESAKKLHEGIYDIKSRLDSKLAEMTSLAAELGMLPRKVGRLAAGKAENDADQPKGMAVEARPRAADAECHTMDEDGRLPPIVEDKYYPRRTLEQQEIQDLVDNEPNLHSPEPDTSKNDEPDAPEDAEMHPVSSPSIHRQQHDVPRDATALPPTLETRKKKKKADLSSPLFKPLQDDRLEASITLQPRRSGSKRKFSPDEDGVWSEVASGDDEFQFSRPSGSPSKRAGTFGLTSQPLSPVKAAKSIDPEPVKPAITNRKVLEPKSANANLSSPNKVRASVKSDQVSDRGLARAGANENMRSPQKPKVLDIGEGEFLNQKPRVVRLGGISQKPKRSGRVMEQEESVLNETPAPSTTDSPRSKPGEQESTSDVANASRPSRRRGTVISYAEPNLRAKMRRPSKGFMDAVAGADSRRSSSFQIAQADSTSGDEINPTQARDRHHSSKADGAADSTSRDDSDHLQSTISRRRRKASSSARDSEGYSDAGSNVDSFDLKEHPSTLKEKTSSKGLSRRHSSNIKSASVSRESARHDLEMVSDMDSSFEADEVAPRRETRITARRRSMMV